MPVQCGRVVAGDVPGAVLEAEHVARCLRVRRRRGRLAEAQLRPADGDLAEADPGQIADRVHRDLRIVGACLHTQIAAAARPVEVVAGELRQVDQRLGAPVLDAEAVLAVLLEERRADAEGQREPGRRQPERLTGVVRRRLGEPAHRAVADRVARRHPRRRLRPLLEEGDQLVAVVDGDVERGEVQPVLDGGGDPGLVRAVERHGRRGHVRHGRCGVTAGAQRHGRTAGRDRAEGQPRTAPAQQRAPRRDAPAVPPGGGGRRVLARRAVRRPVVLRTVDSHPRDPS